MKDDKHTSLSRREFLEGTGLASLALGTGALTDQERYFDPTTLPTGYSLPGREHPPRCFR